MKKAIEIIKVEMAKYTGELSIGEREQYERYERQLDILEKDRSLEELAEMYNKRHKEFNLSDDQVWTRTQFDLTDLSIKRNNKEVLETALNEEEAVKMLKTKLSNVNCMYDAQGMKFYEVK